MRLGLGKKGQMVGIAVLALFAISNILPGLLLEWEWTPQWIRMTEIISVVIFTILGVGGSIAIWLLPEEKV